MNTTTETPHLTLYYRQGHSDKVYQATIEPSGTGFVVNFAYGRRGATLNTGTKTTEPVSFDEAQTIYDRLVREKTAKGYIPGADGTPYRGSEKQVTGLLPQLLNPVEESQLDRLIDDVLWWMQEKFDGRRLLLRKEGIQITGSNRTGLAVGLPEPIIASACVFAHDFVLDGEAIGERFHAFDLLELDGRDLRRRAYVERLTALTNLLASGQQRQLKLVATACSTSEKRRLLEELRSAKKEGVVFKRVDAPYEAGRPNSGGPALKHKFCATLSALVSQVNGKRSVALGLLGEDGWRNAGNVTIPPNHPVPQAGDIVEVRYLYAFPESGVLYQPLYLGVREDVNSEQCTVAQLKFKPVEEEA